MCGSLIFPGRSWYRILDIPDVQATIMRWFRVRTVAIVTYVIRNW